jgi:hypothetical protein
MGLWCATAKFGSTTTPLWIRVTFSILKKEQK